MKLSKKLFILYVLLLASINSYAQNGIKPNYRPVSLEEFTTVELDVLPHSGVQLIFPFVLDDPSLKPAIKVVYAGSEGFNVPASEDRLRITGKNTITIVGNASDGADVFLGTLFINVGGYNITVSLRTQYDVTKVDTGVVFNLSKKDRGHLISTAVDKYKEQVDKDYKKKLTRLDSKSREQALKYVGEVVVSDPEYKSFKIEEEFSLADSRFVFYVDELVMYKSFSTIVFELENKSTVDIKLSSVSLSVIDENDSPRSITGLFNCPSVLESDTVSKCTFSTISPLLMDAKKYDFTFSTDVGSEVVSW